MVRRYWPIVFLILAAFAIRFRTFGDPMLDFDEQLYLVVGDRLLHGHLPYVELWDRKPIGLFLFYAFVRLFGGSGIVEYQIAATACAGATACLIWAIARRATGNLGAVTSATLYVLWLGPFHGTGGQSPVIYNLLTSISAWTAFRANDTDDGKRVARLAFVCMTMSGIAIQFKYTPVVEGIFFGGYFLLRLHKLRTPFGRIALVAAAMIVLALLPTLLATAFYYWSGHLDAFVQANFKSVFQRAPFPAPTRDLQRAKIVILAGPMLMLLPFALRDQLRDQCAPNRMDGWLITGWLLAAVVGFGMLGDFYDFYFLTVLLPLFILLAPLFQRGKFRFVGALLLLNWGLISTPVASQTAPNKVAMATMVAIAKPYLAGGRCLYVYDGPTSLYLLTNACIPTRYLYPDHLTNPTEVHALGVDASAEEARILASRPGVIVTASIPPIPKVYPQTQALVRTALARDYVLVGRVPTPDRVLYLFALRSLHPGPAPIDDPRAADPL